MPLPKVVSGARWIPLFVLARYIPLKDQDEKFAGAARFADDLLSSQNSRRLVCKESEKRAKKRQVDAMDFRWKNLASVTQSCKVEFKWYFLVLRSAVSTLRFSRFDRRAQLWYLPACDRTTRLSGVVHRFDCGATLAIVSDKQFLEGRMHG